MASGILQLDEQDIIFTPNTTNVDYFNIQQCRRYGKMVVLQYNCALKNNIPEWTDIALGTFNVYARYRSSDLALSNNGKVWDIEIINNTNQLIVRTLGQSSNDKTLRGKIMFFI